MQTYGHSSFLRSMARTLVEKSRDGRVRGLPGRIIGRCFGWRLAFGPRMIIDRPREVMQNAILWHGAYEPNVARIVSATVESGSVFFDVGANAGQHSLIAAYQGATVHAFEPVPRLGLRVERNARLNRLNNRIVVHSLAIGADKSSAEFYVAERTDDGSHSLLPGVPSRRTTPIRVNVDSIDNLIANKCLPAPNVVKIDVEGYEGAVLDGAAVLLESRMRPLVIIETSDELARAAGESAQAVLNRLFIRGYVVLRIPQNAGRLEMVSQDAISTEMHNYVCLCGSNDLIHRLRAMEFTGAVQ